MGRRMRAMIIEDQFIGTLIEDALSKLGFSEFEHVDSEQAAVAAARANCPDLITAEQRLDDGTGVNAVRSICAVHGRVATVFITNFQDEVRHSLPETVIIGKPFGDQELKEAVEAAFLIDRRRPDAP